jgi:hypothetical protein
MLFSTAVIARAQLATPPPLQVTFELQPAVTLAGIPTSFRFTFRNPTNGRINVPDRVLLMVRDAAGNPFAPGGGPRDIRYKVWPVEAIPAHGSIVREILSEGSLREPVWLGDGRLTGPGTYQLQAFFVVGTPLEATSIEEIQQHSVVTNTVVLTLQQPRGIDAEVWKEMLAFCRGKWNPGCVIGPADRQAAFVKHVVTDYPRSTYAGWFATMMPGPTEEERAAVLRDWLAHAPADDYTDWRRLALAEWEVALSDKYHQTKPEISRVHEAAARELLTALIKNAKIDALRARAQDRLDYLNEPEPED